LLADIAKQSLPVALSIQTFCTQQKKPYIQTDQPISLFGQTAYLQLITQVLIMISAYA